MRRAESPSAAFLFDDAVLLRHGIAPHPAYRQAGAFRPNADNGAITGRLVVLLAASCGYGGTRCSVIRPGLTKESVQ
jgi:hypothetical protein